MKLEQQVCSLELANKLKELGVKQESCFFWLEDKKTGKRMLHRDITEQSAWPFGHCSAFTVAELGEKLSFAHSYWSSGKKWDTNIYECTYGLEVMFDADTEADARAKMLCYLIENKLITL